MPEFEVEASNGHRANGAVPVLPRPEAKPQFMDPDERAALQGFMAEMDIYHTEIKGFWQKEPDQVLLECSSYLARLGEIRSLLYRNGSTRANQLRSREVEPMIHDLREQFTIHSRLQSIRELDWKMMGGKGIT